MHKNSAKYHSETDRLNQQSAQDRPMLNAGTCTVEPTKINYIGPFCILQASDILDPPYYFFINNTFGNEHAINIIHLY